MSVFFILITIAMLAVLGSLFVGLFAMARGDATLSQKAMRARVALQAVAVLLVLIAFATPKS